jgi:hypothetical protein
MKILGIYLHWPTNREMTWVVAIVICWTAILTLLHSANLIQARSVVLAVTAITIGILARSCGISIDKDGFRAVALLFLVSSFVFPIVLMLLN